jgi:hypothetical protein
VISAHARRATSAEASHVTSAKATSMTSTEATHGTCAEAATAPVSSAAAATTTTTASASVSLRTRRKQRPGQQGGCQYHHRFSSSHDIFLSMARAISDHFSPGAHMVAGLPIANGKFRRQ